MKLLYRLLNPGIFVGVLLTALLVVAAYQVRPTYAIGIGSPTDSSLVRGFNTPEVLPGEVAQPFRWTTADSYVTLRDVGRQDFNIILTVSGFRPAGQEAPSLKVDAGGGVLLDVTPAPRLTNYSFAVPRDAANDGTLVLHLKSNTFVPPGDPNPRDLGVVVTGVLVEPGANPDRFIEVPPRVIVALVAAAALLGLFLALLGWGPGAVGLISSLLGVLAGWLLASDRLWLTSGRWYEGWFQALLAGALFAVLAGLLGAGLSRLTGARWPAPERRWLLTLLMLAFAVRLAGQLHPLINIVDLGFHQHRFDTVQSGQLLFTIKSAEWGGRSTFYLPTAYISMLPLQWLLNDSLLVIKLFTVGVGTLGAGLVYLIGRGALKDGRAGLLAAMVYVTMPISVLPFSWGITTNLFGEFFALCALTMLVTNYRGMQPSRPAFWGFLAALVVALLSHPGVVQLTGLAFGVIALLWLILGGRGDRRVRARVPAGAWAMGALVLAASLSYILYYSHFAADMLKTLDDIRRERAAQARPGGLRLLVGGSVSDKSLGLVVQYVENRRDWLLLGLRGFWNEAAAYYRMWPLFGALLGFLLVWPGKKAVYSLAEGRRKLALAAVGWAAAVLFFAVVGWAMNLYVRYALFALPIVAVGGGVLLSRVWRRGRVGPVLACLTLAFFTFQALALWQYRITYAFK